MEGHLNFAPLLLVLFLAFLVPLALARFRLIPAVVGEILVGMLIGDAWLGLVSGDEPVLRLLSEIGFAFLMFLSGLEIDFSVLFGAGRDSGRSGSRPLRIAGLSFLAALLLAAAAGWGLTLAGLARDPWMMALILSTTSLGIVVPVLKERGLSASRYGQALLLAALVADFSTMFLITLYVAVRSNGITVDILLIGILFLAVLLVYRLGSWQLRRPGLREMIDNLAEATTQVKVRGAMALMMAFVVLAEALGVELILGAFLAGAVISLLSGPEDHGLRHKLDGLGFGFFIPLFFIVVGLQFDLQAFLNNPSSWILAPLLLVVAFLIKVISAFFFRAGFSWRETFAGGALLSARLSLIIAASAIGLRLGSISEATNAAIILVAALTATLAPLFFNLILPDTKTSTPSRILLYGQNDTAAQVKRVLEHHGEEVINLGTSGLRGDGPGRREPDGARAAAGEGDLDSLKKRAGKALVALAGDDDRNLAVCQAAFGAGIRNVIALVNDPARLPEYRGLSIKTFVPSLYQPTLLAMLARNPDLFELMTSTEDDQDVREIELRNQAGAGVPLQSLGIRGDLLILSIGRDGEIIIPHGSTRLEIGDRLTILGEKDALAETCAWLEQR
jgi:Kef-type K+ transport system membrane component KefB/Trk K+ transport system NAD-binding subunit